MEHNHELQATLRPQVAALRELIPDTWAGFAQLHKSSMAAGELDRATKELIALAISVVEGCDGCIAAHARGAARHGANRQQVAEALGVTLLMDGGPASVYAPRALAAFDEFSTN
ncbi:MAG: carboxymuconolactone decarboxylase family protein [Acidimicrobiia bacterium]|nr:carboxymuconolactone decarboxylase family protein [Acidimicrobiia bacterium]